MLLRLKAQLGALGVGVGVLDSTPVDVLCGQSLGACGPPRPGTVAEMADSGRGRGWGEPATWLLGGWPALSRCPWPPSRLWEAGTVSSAAEGLQGGMWPPLPTAAQVQS